MTDERVPGVTWPVTEVRDNIVVDIEEHVESKKEGPSIVYIDGGSGRVHTESNSQRQRNENATKIAVACVEHIELNVTVYTAGNERKTATQLLGNSRTTSFPGMTCCKPVYQVP
uniref:Uncharacterized protein n=1 Tax=Timema tahoe TaxID=61484 RepID=A0A7R9IJG9_9NEOP|nr:unnamed protein product [Timema tahoe]